MSLTATQINNLRKKYNVGSVQEEKPSDVQVANERINRLKTNTYIKQEPAISQELVEQQSEQPEEKGFLSKAGGFLGGLAKDIIKPVAEIGTSAVNLGESVFDLARGDRQGASEALQKERNIPFIGETKPAFTGEETFGQEVKKLGGYGFELASVLPFSAGISSIGKATLKGAVKTGLKKGAIEGAIGGGLAASGRAAQEDNTLAGIMSQGALGTFLGGSLGAGLGATLPAVGAGVRKILEPVEDKISKTVSQAIDKGIKPYFGGKTTQTMRNNYNKKAAEAFSVISKVKPAIYDEKVGEKIVKLPTTRKEMLEALGETKRVLFDDYSALAKQAGDEGAKFNVAPIQEKLYDITQDVSYNPQIRKYADNLIDEIAELQGATPDIIQKRVEDLNSSLAGFYEGRMNKAKAQLDASTAKLMREELDNIINKTTGENYQAIKNQYGALKTIEKDLARQVNLEARKSAKGLFDITDIFTGGDLSAGIITANPTLVAKGATGKGIKELYKFLNDPNRYIKNAFEVLENPPMDVKKAIQEANEFLNKRAGLTIEDVTQRADFNPPAVGQTADLLQEAKNVTLDEFIDKNIDNYVKKTKEYKDWAKGNKNIIEAYHGTPYSFDKFEIGKKQSGVYDVQGISFATKPELAEPFSRQYPDWYFDKKKVIDSKYPNIDNILTKEKRISQAGDVEKVKKNLEYEKKQLAWIEKDLPNTKSHEETLWKIKDFERKLETLQDNSISQSEKAILDKYKKELKTLEDSVQGNIYKVYVKGKNIIDEIGEDIGFGSQREGIVAELDGDILRIKDADTGQYIGEEIIVNDPNQVFIVNSPKIKSQLEDIWKEANKK